jgi:hypothetical protein
MSMEHIQYIRSMERIRYAERMERLRYIIDTRGASLSDGMKT